jgi:DNA-binding response OmpR family regulator
MTIEGAPARILVVEDEPAVADTLTLVLRRQGFDVRAVHSGEEAAVVALEWKPETVITDVVMGQMDGVALATYLAQALPSCRVLLISGNTEAAQLIDAAKNLGHDFPILAKPFHPEALFAMLAATGAEAV